MEFRPSTGIGYLAEARFVPSAARLLSSSFMKARRFSYLYTAAAKFCIELATVGELQAAPVSAEEAPVQPIASGVAAKRLHEATPVPRPATQQCRQTDSHCDR
jgi:hypothetical protein